VNIDILTLFPEMFVGPFDHSIIGRARENGLVNINIRNIRDHAHDKHGTADDSPFGGGTGMVMKPEPIFEAVEAVLPGAGDDAAVILLTPQGRLFNQKLAWDLSKKSGLIFICGRYEGVDGRVEEHLATDLISIGDYVLAGGEIPAMAIVDALVRLLPGVVGSGESIQRDSHTTGLLQYAQYTRPETFRGWTVPPVLLSGNHAEIARWRREQSLLKTLRRRPELLENAGLSESDKKFLAKQRARGN
jgi:tRNA (guanine37-N1)-methyltransferase